MRARILIRGGGDLASGVALRLLRARFQVIITELAQPLAVRRAASFSEAVYENSWDVEGVQSLKADSLIRAIELASSGIIPIMIAPEPDFAIYSSFHAVVDARLTKTPPGSIPSGSPFLIGLGPGFCAGQNCHAAIETQRGHTLGRVIWQGDTLSDTGTPEGDPRRVLRAPAAGQVQVFAQIGQHVEEGQLIAKVGQENVMSPLGGVLRGLIRPGMIVPAGLKIGDIDPRNRREYCYMVSDKALAIGGGVLEALLAKDLG